MANYADLELHQGEDTVFRLEIIDSDKSAKDLTGFTGRSYFKKSYSLSDSDTYSFSVEIPEPYTQGYLDLILDGTTSDDLKRGRYFYDVFLLNDTASEKILEGRLEIMPSATSIT
jgi:hypothetical protein